jgi:hypothetical protein
MDSKISAVGSHHIECAVGLVNAARRSNHQMRLLLQCVALDWILQS